jgi:hypothetical protein
MELARMAATTRGSVTQFLVRPDEAVTLGRSSDCTVPLQDPKASRRHCQLSFAQGRVVAVDLASSHGLLHRGARQQLVALAVGDGFHIGETFVRFVGIDRADAEAAAPAAPPPSQQQPAPPLAPPPPPRPVFADEVPPPPAAPPPAFADEVPAVAPPAAAADVVRLPPTGRRAPSPATPSSAKSFAARLAAEAVVSALHLALCVVVLLLVKKAFGFDLYQAFGLTG